MARALRVSPDLALPLDFATEGVAVSGMRGSGKSNTLARWVEVLFGASIPVCVIDPKGDWSGVRSSADGKSPGLPIPVFGGLDGDFPLDRSLGKQIANLLVDENLSAVLDVSRLSIGDRVRFLTDFFNELLERHKLEPHVRCVVMEEAHRYIPQVVKGPVAELKEAAASILLEGRAFGLGGWAATQRPARLHKDFLEEVGTMIVHRIGVAATNDLRTISGWVKHEDLGDEIVESLTKLGNGEAWVLGPSTLGIAQRVQFDRRETFDSAATPKVGASSRRPATMADIDAGAIKEALATSIEKAKADDPKELRRRIKELEQQLASSEAKKQEPVVEYVNVPVLSPDDVKAFADVGHQVLELADRAGDLSTLVQSGLERLDRAIERFSDRPDVPRAGRAGDPARAVADRPRADRAAQRARPPARREPSRPAVPRPEAAAGELGGGVPAKILTALAQHHPEPLSQRRIAALVGVTQKKSTMRNALARLRKFHYVEGGDPLSITDEGLAVADVEALPTGDELLEHWRSQLGDGKPRLIFDLLVDTYPDQLEPDDIAEHCDIEPGTSTLRNAMARLRNLGLVEGWTLSEDLAAAVGL